MKTQVSIRIDSLQLPAFGRRLSSALTTGAAVFCILGSPFGVPVVYAADTTPPSVPTNLTAAVATCGQVNLSWNASTDEVGGSGLKGYTIIRTDIKGVTSTESIGAERTAYADTHWLPSSSSVTYTVVAFDNAGNRSAASNAVSAFTPPCPVLPGEQVLDSTLMNPLGKSMAVYGSLTALIYEKQNATIPSNLDTWITLRSTNSAQASTFLLHNSPGYRQIESDYVLTSNTELWTLSYDGNLGGHVLASQYRLNGSPATSATLVSTKSLGDGYSAPKAMILLKSGALMIMWNEEGMLGSYISPDGSLNTGFAYRSPTGSWAVNFPLNVPNPYGGSSSRTQMALAQHPADGSIWAFAKRDSFTQIIGLHFTETTSGFTVDWVNPGYLSITSDGVNGPEAEFPFLAAVPDSTRSVILLAYQSSPYTIIFVDSLLNISNGIFLKESNAVIAQISANGGKSFIPFVAPFERAMQFGFSLLADGSFWLTYQPIDHAALTKNQVYASHYVNNVWSAPSFVGYKYTSIDSNGAPRDPGDIISQPGQPQVAFWTPDQKIHTFALANASSVASPCDLNNDNAINGVDVQLAINQALGLAGCTADVNRDGVCNVIDVQRVTNAALGGPCVSP